MKFCSEGYIHISQCFIKLLVFKVGHSCDNCRDSVAMFQGKKIVAGCKMLPCLNLQCGNNVTTRVSIFFFLV